MLKIIRDTCILLVYLNIRNIKVKGDCVPYFILVSRSSSYALVISVLTGVENVLILDYIIVG